MLIKTEIQIPPICVRCLAVAKTNSVHVYKDALLNLASEDKFREQMVEFSLSDIDSDHRDGLVPIITRILYGKLLKRKAKSSKDKFSIANRRAIVLAFFSALTPSELRPFFE